MVQKTGLFEFFDKEGKYEHVTNSEASCNYATGCQSKGFFQLKHILDCQSQKISVQINGSKKNNVNESFDYSLHFSQDSSYIYSTSLGGHFKGTYTIQGNELVLIDQGFSQYAGKILHSKVIFTKQDHIYLEKIFYYEEENNQWKLTHNGLCRYIS